jgi:hypothetical protein
MNKLARHPSRAALAFLAFAISSLASSAELPAIEYRPVVLVCTLDAPDLPPEKGALAAETIAAAIEAGGLAHASRPQYKLVQDWDYSVDVAPRNEGRNDDQKDRSGRQNSAAGRAYVSAAPTTQLREASRPDADYRVEGAVARMGEGVKTWWVHAALYDEATNEKLRTASAAGDAGLLEASKAVAAELENVYKFHVLEERTEAVRRSVEIGDFSRATALKRLDEMRQRWPDALPPPAVGLLLVSAAKPAEPQAVMQWGAWTVERLPSAGLAGKRLLLRLGIGNPYELLAAAYDSAGRKSEAAAVRRQAVDEGYASPPKPGESGMPLPQSGDSPAGAGKAAEEGKPAN